MGTIYKITLESVSVKYSNNPGAFDINAFWEVEQTAGQNTNQYTISFRIRMGMRVPGGCAL